MIIDLGSFSFGSSLLNGTGTPSWGTSVGQSSPEYKITREGADRLIMGMVYCSVPTKNVKMPVGRGGRVVSGNETDAFKLAAVFHKVYVNDIKIDYPFVLVLEKEDSVSHPGRLSIRYSDKITYQTGNDSYSNALFVQKVRDAFDMQLDACWFAYDIDVKRQDTLLIRISLVNANNSEVYLNSEVRKRKWAELIPDLETRQVAINNNVADPIIDNIDCDYFIELLEENHNLVLTGSPGTGKTTLAKLIAKKMGAITQFVQFHPSYDYTDFVEGLRPKVSDDDSDDSSGVSFERKDGIFKSFCKQAIRYSTQESDEFPEEEFDVGSFDDIMSTIKDDIKRGVLDEYSPTGRLSVNGDNRIQYNRIKTRKTILESNVELLFSYFVAASQYDISAITKEELQSIIEQLTSDRRRVTRTLDFTEYKWTLQELLKRKEEMNDFSFVRNNTPINKPFVFIIDEINRGELSKIFGELFFAIDPGYRGEKGLVSTQYQELITDDNDLFKQGFYVPNNVYIIGTMNDIDRSVESMDFAVRRRFAWREITAEQSADNMGLSEEVKERMKRVNDTIEECELSPAYHIGGAYFLKLRDGDYESLWTNHIKGLIEEYYRGNPDGPGYVEKIHKALIGVQ